MQPDSLDTNLHNSHNLTQLDANWHNLIQPEEIWHNSTYAAVHKFCACSYKTCYERCPEAAIF